MSAGYLATTITITDTTKRYQLLQLLTGVTVSGATVGHSDAGLSLNCRKLVVQADVANGAAKGYFGDSSVAATDAGASLQAGDSMTLAEDRNNIALNTHYVRGDVNPTKLNVQVFIQ